jgi:hypothetical protein
MARRSTSDLPNGMLAEMADQNPISPLRNELRLAESQRRKLSNQVPAVKSYDYAMLQNEISSKKIVDIITQ